MTFFYGRSLIAALLLAAVILGGIVAVRVAAVERNHTAEDLEEYPLGPLPDSLRFDRLEVYKKKRLLIAYSNGVAVRRYLVALGREPVGPKRIQGDGKTPEGEYLVDARNAASAYYKNLNISYPSKMDRAYAAKLGKSPGGDIKIHGLAPRFAYLGALHRQTDWTEGCIAVTNSEMEELFTRTILGSPILILP